MTWWTNPTPDLVTVRVLDDDNVEHVFLIPPGDVGEIPAFFDRGIQRSLTPGSPPMGVAPMLVRVDEATVKAAKAEAEKPEPVAIPPEPETRPDTLAAKAHKRGK